MCETPTPPPPRRKTGGHPRKPTETEHPATATASREENTTTARTHTRTLKTAHPKPRAAPLATGKPTGKPARMNGRETGTEDTKQPTTKTGETPRRYERVKVRGCGLLSFDYPQLSRHTARAANPYGGRLVIAQTSRRATNVGTAGNRARRIRAALTVRPRRAHSSREGTKERGNKNGKLQRTHAEGY